MIAISSSFQLAPDKVEDRQKLADAAKKFEAIFARQMLASARKANLGDDMFASQANDTFKQMMDERFADIMAENGSLGLGKSIEAQLAKHLGMDEGA